MFDFSTPQDHRGHRLHRFMESADINAAFDLLFRGLRRQVQRGLRVEGQFYALEADDQVPGQMNRSARLSAAQLDHRPAAAWSDPQHRQALYERLLADPGPSTLYAYVCEQRTAHDVPVVHAELIEADGWHTADFPLCAGRGWESRDLLETPHQRLAPVTQD